MATRNTNGKLFAAALTVTTNSDAYFIEHADKVGFHLVTSNGDCVGTIKIQVCNDETNWTDVYVLDYTGALVADSAVSSGINSIFLRLLDPCARWCRAVYTKTSGTTSVFTVYALAQKIGR